MLALVKQEVPWKALIHSSVLHQDLRQRACRLSEDRG